MKTKVKLGIGDGLSNRRVQFYLAYSLKTIHVIVQQYKLNFSCIDPSSYTVKRTLVKNVFCSTFACTLKKL